MTIYKAKCQIDHGLADGSVVRYAPGDEVPAKLADLLPHLVETIDVPGVARVTADKPAADPSKPKTLARMNQAEFKAEAEKRGINTQGLDSNTKLREAIEAFDVAQKTAEE